ncbi:hypothetical protein RF11_03051 [Thelohanellus kitauei]|uniref:Uncharacterized protein n=1 Tax=Thelohanellus kitauei TaxID=669202 RepID=A0A0C2MNN5_THEKT|nr:hypothetical protein RF11_03051 [Thelohanellus kitauei]
MLIVLNTSMGSSNHIGYEDNHRVCFEYIGSTYMGNTFTQMEAVRKFISQFFPQSLSETDYLFINHFPMELYGEFFWMSEGGTRIHLYEEKKILIFDVFTFIFRNASLVTNRKAKSFIVLILKLIKICDGIPDFDPNPLLESIINCIIYDPNKVMFINENAMILDNVPITLPSRSRA